MENTTTFNSNTPKILTVIFRNLPMTIFIVSILIRILTAVPVAIVSVQKFMFFGTITALIIGIASTILLESILTVLSLVNANFRKNKEIRTMANWLLLIVVLLTAYNSYLIQSITEFYDVTHPIEALLTIHVLNVVSILLIELMSFITVKIEIIETPKPVEKPVPVVPIETLKTAPESELIKNSSQIPEQIKLIKSSDLPLDEKIQKLHETDFFKTQKAIADYLFTSQSTVTRVISKLNNN